MWIGQQPPPLRPQITEHLPIHWSVCRCWVDITSKGDGMAVSGEGSHGDGVGRQEEDRLPTKGRRDPLLGQ